MSLFVREAGSGSPVVLVHGWPQHSGIWDGVTDRVAPHHRVLAPDLPGFGRSPAPAEGFGTGAFARELLDLLDERAIDRATFVGHDWGGNTVLRIAELAPQRVERALSIGSPHLWLRPSLALARGAWRSWYAALLALPLASKLAPRLLAKGPQGLDAKWAAHLAEPGKARATTKLYRSYFRQIGTRHRREGPWPPMHAMVGEDEQAFPLVAVTGGDPPPEFSHEVVPGIGHWIPEERPELIADWILAR